MSDLNLNSPTGIIYIVLIIVACLVVLWAFSKIKVSNTNKENQRLAALRQGGKRRKLKRQTK